MKKSVQYDEKTTLRIESKILLRLQKLAAKRKTKLGTYIRSVLKDHVDRINQ